MSTIDQKLSEYFNPVEQVQEKRLNNLIVLLDRIKGFHSSTESIYCVPVEIVKAICIHSDAEVTRVRNWWLNKFKLPTSSEVFEIELTSAGIAVQYIMRNRQTSQVAVGFWQIGRPKMYTTNWCPSVEGHDQVIKWLADYHGNVASDVDVIRYLGL